MKIIYRETKLLYSPQHEGNLIQLLLIILAEKKRNIYKNNLIHSIMDNNNIKKDLIFRFNKLLNKHISSKVKLKIF
jgi:hypothetical protein